MIAALNHTVLTYDPADFAEADQMEPSPHELDQARQDYLEWLYERDGRHDPSHPMHSLYTGLAVGRQGELTRSFLDLLGQDLMEVEIEVRGRRGRGEGHG